MSPIELPMAPTQAPTPEPPSEVHAGARRFRVEGMDCGACAKTVEQAVAALAGVEGAQVSFGNGTLAVEGKAPDEDILGAVARAGYRALPAARRVETDGKPFWRRDGRAVSTTVSDRTAPCGRRGIAHVRATRDRRAVVPVVDGGRRVADRTRRVARASPPAPGHERADGARGGRCRRHRRVCRGCVGAGAVRGRHGAGSDGAGTKSPHGRVADGPRPGAGARPGRRQRSPRRC